MLHAFEGFSTTEQVLLGLVVPALIIGFCICLYRWIWNQGFVAGKLSQKTQRREKQAVDTQQNAYGRIKNALSHLEKKDYQLRGVQIVGLGNHNQKDVYIINIFWKNEHCGMGILGIEIHLDSIRVASMDAPCPSGYSRDYVTSDIQDKTVSEVIADVQKFITEAYSMASEAARAGAR
jgi:hypothetical protein